MTFQDAIKTCFAKYADFKGRALRSEYWWFWLFTVIVGLALTTVSEAMAGIFYVGALLPSLAAAARRLHDTGRTGWWLLIGFIPLVGAIVLVVFMTQEGSGIDNEYGPAPIRD
jgi:uncharacterized membrane protein YhaH (DUF805 family)